MQQVGGRCHRQTKSGSVLICFLLFLSVGIVTAEQLVPKTNLVFWDVYPHLEAHHQRLSIRQHEEALPVWRNDWRADEMVTKTSLVHFHSKTGMVTNAADNIESNKAAGFLARIRDRLNDAGRGYGTYVQFPLCRMISREYVKPSNWVNFGVVTEFPLFLGGIESEGDANRCREEFGIGLNILRDGLADVFYRQLKYQNGLLAVHKRQAIYWRGLDRKPRTFRNVGLLLDGDSGLERGVGLVAVRFGLALEEFQLLFDSYSILSRVLSRELNSFLSGGDLSMEGDDLCIGFSPSIDRIIVGSLGLLTKYPGLRGHLSELTVEDVSRNERQYDPAQGKPKHSFLKRCKGIVLNDFYKKALGTGYLICAFWGAYLASAIIWKFREWIAGGLVRVPIFVCLTILAAVLFGHGVETLGWF